MKTTKTQIKVVFADDQLVLREGFYAMLRNEPSINIVAHACNGDELLRQVALHRPDVVLTDIKMPGMDGIEATLKITKDFPGTPVIAYTMFSEDYLIVDMRNAGALGYVLKDAGLSDILSAINAAYKGQEFHCPDTRVRLKQMVDANIYDPDLKISKSVLSNREREVLIHICNQKTNPEIAELMKISIRTVEVFRTRLFNKTNSKNMAGLVTYAFRFGVCDPSIN